jgi:hypothetical protein
MKKLISAAGGSVPSFWPKLFANLVKTKGMQELVQTAAKPGQGVAGGAGGAGGAAAEEEEEEEEVRCTLQPLTVKALNMLLSSACVLFVYSCKCLCV